MVIRTEVIQFAEVMEEKLRKNDHKGGWRNDHVIHLSDRILMELSELKDAIYSGRTEDAMKECADIANFAMMVYDNLKYKFEEEKRIKELGIGHDGIARGPLNNDRETS